VQAIFKHAISTISPAKQVVLNPATPTAAE
jgi:sRNA-binding regulator protein Hfq